MGNLIFSFLVLKNSNFPIAICTESLTLIVPETVHQLIFHFIDSYSSDLVQCIELVSSVLPVIFAEYLKNELDSLHCYIFQEWKDCD